ncbi:MAG TPA: hypothetical protein VH593_04925 [Ktedonobacteraceae bacterium]|jgi:hypothetical protein
MAYYDISLLASDGDFAQRTMACYATETLEKTDVENPSAWWSNHNWDMAAMPGFGDAYASGIAGGVENPGRDPSVITDGQILSAVQAINSQAQPAA